MLQRGFPAAQVPQRHGDVIAAAEPQLDPHDVIVGRYVQRRGGGGGRGEADGGFVRESPMVADGSRRTTEHRAVRNEEVLLRKSF